MQQVLALPYRHTDTNRMNEIKNIQSNFGSNRAHSFVEYVFSHPLSLWDGFFIASIQPFNWPCDYIDINQLREVIFKIIYVYKFDLSNILLVPALLAATGDLNQIKIDDESYR